MALTTRTFPVLLLLLWLAAAGLLFAAALYGDYDALVNAARKGEIRRELSRMAESAATRVQDSAWRAVQSVEEYEQEVVKDIKTGLAEELRTMERELGADEDGAQDEETPPARSGALVDAAFTPAQEGFTAVFTFEPTAPDHTWFTMNDPPLLAVDFPGEWEQQVQRRKVFSPGPVDKVIIGRHPEYIRAVLYFAHPDGPQGPPPTIVRRDKTVTVTVPAGD